MTIYMHLKYVNFTSDSETGRLQVIHDETEYKLK